MTIAIDKKLNVIVTKDGGETGGLKILTVNHLCIVQEDTILWYFKNWGASLPFMPEWSKGTVCKTVFRGFESHSRFYTNLFAYGQKIKKRAF